MKKYIAGIDYGEYPRSHIDIPGGDMVEFVLIRKELETKEDLAALENLLNIDNCEGAHLEKLHYPATNNNFSVYVFTTMWG